MFDYEPTPNQIHADDWLEGWYTSLKVNPTKVIYADDETDLTKEDVEQISGSVYGYLKAKGIGREDFVMVHLPRGARVFAACLGVTKAGAAFIIVEEGYPAERVEAIRSDIDCAFELNAQTFAEACNQSNYLRGFEHAEDHDAAYAVYTSGTTGKPCGVIQERGSMHMSHVSLCENGAVPEDVSVCAPLSPMNFSAMMYAYACTANKGGYVYIPSYETLKNAPKLMEALGSRGIRCTFMAPSMLRALADKLPETLTTIFVGAAPADRVWAGPNRKTYNFYMCTETCFVIAKCVLDAPMDNPPVGLAPEGIDVRLGEQGEVIVKTPFCRGYVGGNADGETGSYFADGEYHSSDLARMDDEGNYVLCGRASDMIKIDGNRVEPAEVEAAFHTATGLECVARGFEDIARDFIALYYVPGKDAPELDADAVRRKMADLVPYYMIPAHILPIEALPYTQLGKLDRKSLPRPASAACDYVAPRDELEERLCNAAQKVLGLKQVGIADDFFELGGSSMDAIAVLSELDLKGLEISYFYRGRTIGGIAELYRTMLKETDGVVLTDQEKEIEGRKHLYSESEMLTLFYIATKAPQLTSINNFPVGLRFSRLVNLKKMRDVINDYTSSSSTFNTIIALNEQQMPSYKYAPEMYKPVEIEEMTEEEVEHLCKTFVQPFRIMEELPWRIRLVHTKKHSYLFWDIAHILTDATGVSLMLNDLGLAYQGKPIHANNLFAWEYDIVRKEQSPRFKEDTEKLVERVLSADWSYMPHDPTEEKGEREGNYDTGITVKQLNEYLKRHHISRAELLESAMALTQAYYTKKRDVYTVIIMANRSESDTNIGGARVRTAYNVVRIGTPANLQDYIRTIQHSMQDSIAFLGTQFHNPRYTPGCISVTLDDLGDLEEMPPILSKFVERIDLTNELEAAAEDSPFSGLAMLIMYQNKEGKLFSKNTVDVRLVSERFRDEIMETNSEILRRIIAGDDSVLTDYLPAE